MPTKTSNGGNNYYEWGVTNPHLVLQDLVAILHPDLMPEHEFAFLSTDLRASRMSRLVHRTRPGIVGHRSKESGRRCAFLEAPLG